MIGGVSLVLAGGCSSGQSPDDFTRAEVDGIARRCGAAPDLIKFNKGFVVISEPGENDPIGTCVFREIKRTGKSNLSVMGNRRYESGR